MPDLCFRNPLKAKLEKGNVTYGYLATLESATTSEVAADLGLDWVVIDMEHGSLSFKDVVNHMRALRGSDTAALVRIPSNSIDNIKRALDLGAHGLFLPLIRTADDVEQAYKYARYPTLGERGLGGERAVHWGLGTRQYVEVADDETMIIPIIETADAIRNMPDILNAPGVQAVFYGLGDLAQSMGYRAGTTGPEIEDAVKSTTELAHAKEVSTGVLCWGVDEMRQRIRQGFRMIGLGTNIKLMITQTRQLLDAMKVDQ